MAKLLTIFLLFFNTLFARQILLVVAEDFNSTTGKLSCIEDGKVVCKEIDVVLGKNGLGWGKGAMQIPHSDDEPVKKEGDGKAPAGIFALTYIFGYDKAPKWLNMPYLHATKELKCIDDTTSPLYNKIIYDAKRAKSFERMRREDGLYRLGIVVGHNLEREKGAGSCIFLHIWRAKASPTVGCTAMSYENIKQLSSWLDISKNPLLIQIPRKYLPYIEKNLKKALTN